MDWWVVNDYLMLIFWVVEAACGLIPGLYLQLLCMMCCKLRNEIN